MTVHMLSINEPLGVREFGIRASKTDYLGVPIFAFTCIEFQLSLSKLYLHRTLVSKPRCVLPLPVDYCGSVRRRFWVFAKSSNFVQIFPFRSIPTFCAFVLLWFQWKEGGRIVFSFSLFANFVFFGVPSLDLNFTLEVSSCLPLCNDI